MSISPEDQNTLIARASAFDRLAIKLGSASDWDDAGDWLDEIAHDIDACLTATGCDLKVGTTADVTAWRALADQQGIEYEEDDDDPEPLAAEDVVYERDEAER